MPEKKYITVPENGRIYELTRGEDGLWRDISGTIWALREGPVADIDEVCGVDPVALPAWYIFEKINAACRPHDYAFSSPAYQAFHTFDEANQYLKALQTIVGFPLLGEIFREISDEFGRKYWENTATK